MCVVLGRGGGGGGGGADLSRHEGGRPSIVMVEEAGSAVKATLSAKTHVIPPCNDRLHIKPNGR